MLDKSKPKHDRETSGIFGFSFPTSNQVLDELEHGDWEVFVLVADQGGDNDLIQGTKMRDDVWCIRHEDWDVEISKEITEYPYSMLVPTIANLDNCILWAEFA